jgi:DNA-binding winged helix-turn-helix (wHTH) protein
MSEAMRVRVTFGAFTLDARTRQLLCGTSPVAISPKAFDLFALLVQQRPAAVSKADIHRQLWPDTFVSDGNLTVLMTELRAALGDNARQPTYLRTVQRFGYAFVAAATETSTPAAAQTRARCWLVSATDRAPLAPGDNVVGRGAVADIRVGLDPAADLRLDATGMSRRHALVVVGDAEVTLEDLASKNGTFANEVRVTSRLRLEDGASIRLGSTALQFRRIADVSATQTQEVATTG